MKIKSLILSVVLAACAITAPVFAAETLREGQPVCSSQASLDGVIAAIESGNTHALASLERLGLCGVSGKGMPYTILKIVEGKHDLRYAEVRVLTSAGSKGYIDVWVLENATY